MSTEIIVEDYSVCYVCGARLKSDWYNPSVWENTYECGCVIGGALTDEFVYCWEKCPTTIKIKGDVT